MKRKRRCGRRNPKMASEEGANKGSLNVCLNTQDNWIPVYYDNAEFDSRTQADTPQNDRNESRQQEGFQNLEAVNAKMVGSMSLFPETDAATPANLSKKGRSKMDKSSRGRASSRLKPISNTELVHGRRPSQKDPKLPHQDPLYKEQELKTALPVIRKIMKMDAAEPFNVPMDPIALGIPDYFDVVDTPMDFGTICNNLENGVKYKNSKDVFRDVQCIWDNFSKYNNEGHYILELMKRVKKNFTKFWTEAGLHWEQPQEINGHSHLHSRESTVRQSPCGHWCPMSHMQRNQTGISQPQLHQHPPSLSCNQPSQTQQKCVPCHSSFEQPQPSRPHAEVDLASTGHLCSPPHAESVIRYRKYGPCPVGPMTDYTSHEQQAPSQMLPRQPSASYGQPNQLQQGTCQVKLNSSQPQPLQPQTGTEVESADLCSPPPTESMIRCSKRGPKCPMRPMTDYASHEQQDQLGSSQTLLHHPLPSYGQPNQPQSSQPQTSMGMGTAGPIRQKTRGRRPTWCLNVWNSEDKISIATNKLGQPIGPETPILTNFLGTIARNGHMAPLNYVDWRALPDANKENMWQQVQSKFDIDPISKSWVLKSLGKKWKDWKAELKANHYTTHETDEERLADRDERVLPDQWRILISFWNSKEAKELSIRNKAIRSLQKTSHTKGRKSFARVREEQRAKRPDGKEPSRAELFILTRTRKDGRPINEASSALISELREQAAQQQGGRQNGTVKDDIFFKVMGEDRHGRVRTYGLGPAPSDLMGVTPSRAEAIRIVSEANVEVRDMKERMVAMEQTCAQMAAQMTTMMSMMSNMQKLPAEHGSPYEGLRVRQDADVSTNSGVSPELQVHPSSSVQGAPLHQRHATNRGKTQNTSTRKVSGRRS